MIRIFATLPVIAALAACGQPPQSPPQQQQREQIVVRSAAQKQLFGLDDLNRAIALKRAVRDSGSSCLRVTKSGYVGRFKSMDYWTATCEDEFSRTRDWALFIGADDSVQARLCSDVAKVDLPECKIAADPRAAGAP